ncbi:MAG: response regulator [Treponema sp.]|nr:response regulator [Treponema sp.]
MKIMSSRPLYIQLIFTALAFTAMVVLSYFFMRDIVHKSLVSNAESVFSFAQTQLEADLLEPRMLLQGFSQTIRNMLIRGDSAEAIENYTKDITNYLHFSGSRVLNGLEMYGYFEAFGDPLFIGSGEIPEDFDPQSRPWFNAAVSNCGILIETPPYESVLNGNIIITYARCIHDNNDKRLGVICLNVNIKDIGEKILDIAMERGGYGIVISQDLKIISHTNSDYIGRSLYDADMPMSVFANDIAAGIDIVERPLVNWKGEKNVVYVKRLPNGWYLALLTPESHFYKSISSMALILFAFGSFFAVVLAFILIRIDAARNKSDRDSKHKSQFLANMSHEIRTPMNAIIGMTTIGKTSAEVDKKDRCFNKIEDASNHLLGVINDILDMSKIEANKFDLSPCEFDFEKMLQRIVNVVNFRIDEKDLKLTVHIDRNIPAEIIGDDHRLAQVITNLLGNAIKFTPEHGSIHLDTRFIEEIDGICTIQFSVSDTGIGMTAEQQKRIFTSFEQAESSTTRKYGGTGLGLPISKSIVELMGGKIWVVSEYRRGSTFFFTVQMKRGKTSLHKGLLSEDINLSNVRILVVDDDPYILDYFKDISKVFQVHCDTASSGYDAIKFVEEKGLYHIYFIDWKMPGMDGIQLTAELKAHHESAKSVVIMITAAEWSIVEKEAREAGVDKFLSKPLFPSCIANVINEALGIDRKKVKEMKKDINGMFKGKQILLVEDVEINRDIVMSLLEPTGILIDCAENGEEAVNIFSKNPAKYDMVFMDVQMPVMDGYNATRKIRALDNEHAKNVRIIAMTANVFREDIERCLEAGMDNHIGKPLDFNEVIEKLNIYLPKNR